MKGERISSELRLQKRIGLTQEARRGWIMVPLELVLCDNLMLVITEFNLGPRSPGTSLFS